MTQQVDAFGKPVTQSPPSPPKSLEIARWLWIGSALLAALRSFVQLVDRQKLTEQLRVLNPKATQDQIDTAVNDQILYAVLLAGLTVAYAVLLSNRMRSGRNWARVLLAVFGGFNALGTLLTVCMVGVLGTALITRLTGIPVTLTDLLFSSVVMILNAAALTMMFQRDANRFFRDIRAVPATTSSVGHR